MCHNVQCISARFQLHAILCLDSTAWILFLYKLLSFCDNYSDNKSYIIINIIIIYYLLRNMAYLCLFIDTVYGHYANMLSTDSRLHYFARLQTPYMSTTDMCLELYYQLKSTAIVDKPIIQVGVINEEKRLNYLALSNGDNRTSWDRLFAKLPDELHRIVIEGRRSATQYCGMSIDDVVVQPCDKFGEYLSFLDF